MLGKTMKIRKEIRLTREQGEFLANAAFLFSRERRKRITEADIIREALDAYRERLENVMSETEAIMQHPDFAKKIEALKKHPGELSTYGEAFG